MGIYKSYDIRGIYDEQWNRETAYRIGLALPALLEAGELLVGRDARASSDEIFDALSRGVMDAGCGVCDLGLCSTPSVYFATAFYQAAGSVMITASHNPPQYNGLKVSGRNAVPVGYESGLAELERMVRSQNILVRPGAAGRVGKMRALDIRGDYLGHLAPYAEGIGRIKAVIDCSDGMAGVFLHDVIKDLDADITLMYDKPDGSFPHHAPNPLDEANLADLKLRTLEEGADLGICFDGDADRVMFVDEQGRFVSPDLITAVLGLHFAGESGDLGGQVVTYDVRSSRSVVEFIEALGGRPTICKVGHSHAKKLLRQTDGIFGGELAGHYYFRDNFYCDSGMIAALIVLSTLSKEGVPLSRLMQRINRYHFSGEINFTVSDKDPIIARVKQDYAGGRLETIDGIRIDFDSWWFSLRKSNTEPYLRLVLEADTAEELSRRTGELRSRVETYNELYG